MNDFSERIKLAREKLAAAEAVVIGAGAGLSAAAGLDYSGPGATDSLIDSALKDLALCIRFMTW